MRTVELRAAEWSEIDFDRAEWRIPAERMKMTVTILDADLRADAVRVSPQRQVLANGQWVDSAVQAATAQKLEDIILTKARDLRRA